MKSESTEAKLARLTQMANKAGEALFERAGLAVDVLNDAVWVVATYKGDYGEAEEKVAEIYFPDMVGIGWFGKLLILRRTYPDVAHWQQHKFSLQRLWAEHESKVKPPKEPPPEPRIHVTRKMYEELKEERDSAQYQLRREKAKATDWEERCRDLERELHEAKGRIATLEAILERYTEAAVA